MTTGALPRLVVNRFGQDLLRTFLTAVNGAASAEGAGESRTVSPEEEAAPTGLATAVRPADEEAAPTEVETTCGFGVSPYSYLPFLHVPGSSSAACAE